MAIAFDPIITGFTGVIIGSILTHVLALIREYFSENKKTGRRIYYQIFADLKYCFLIDDVSEKIPDNESKIKELKIRIENILEKNIDYLDKKLFSVYHCLKSDKYIESLGFGEFRNIDHLKTFSNLLKYMKCAFKIPSMAGKKLQKDVDELMHCYKTWFLLMSKFQSWYFVDKLLQGRCLFRRTFKEIYKNKLTHTLLNSENIDEDEFYEIFQKYCFGGFNLSHRIINSKGEKT